ncbi:MAG: MazG family protein [Clostridia bacterium]|nr:MazG family protein [Clostridia bacterium]
MDVNKERYSFSDFCEIIKILRSPGGCSWDREQTHESLKKNLIEESYEYIDALSEGNSAKMCDELGDVLLQIVMNSQIAKEEGTFTMEDVVDTISKKMIRRHPHVFGDVTDQSVSGILTRWEEIKKSEKKEEYSLKSTAKHLPSVLRASILAEKSKKMHKNEIIFSKNIDKLREMLDNIENEETSSHKEILCEMMTTLVELFVAQKIDLETAMYHQNEKYIARFES